MRHWPLARYALVLWLAASVTVAIAAEPVDDREIVRAQAEVDAAFSRYTRFATDGGGDVDQAREQYREAKARLQSLQARSGDAAPVVADSAPAESPAVAAYRRGLAAYAGTQGKPDNALAAREFAVAAKAGHAKAQFNLGRMLWSGDGVPRDVRGAVQWMQRAAESGEANAQFVATTRKPARKPQTEEERRIARDQLGLAEPAKVSQVGDRVLTRARVAGNLIEIWDADNQQWTIILRFRSEGDPEQVRLYSLDADGPQLTGNARALDGEYELRDGSDVERFRVRMTR